MRRLALLLAAASLTACTLALPPATVHSVDTDSTAASVHVAAGAVAPGVAVDVDTAQVHAQIQSLQQQVSELQQQISELQRQHTALSRIVAPGVGRSGSDGSAAGANTAEGSSNRLQQARQQYAAGLYSQAVRTLAGSDSGGDGGREAQNSLYLLLQSHWKLNNCESVIHLGNRFAHRFGRNPQSAEALWLVSQCQWRMQQQDIARDTWRKIIRTYPDSAAAKRAQQRLGSGR